jgi:hypothetical protein
LAASLLFKGSMWHDDGVPAGMIVLCRSAILRTGERVHLLEG